MGDMGDVFRDMKEAKKTFKQENMKNNMDILNKSGISYSTHNNGWHIIIDLSNCFRAQVRRAVGAPAMPIIHFYPSTNKWMIQSVKDSRPKSNVYYGTAQDMLNWIAKLKRSKKHGRQRDI